MVHLLWRIFETNGSVSAYLFYKAMEDEKNNEHGMSKPIKHLSHQAVEQ